MGVLDKVIQMKDQGKNESEIINSLRSQGIPPRDIQDALNQSQIKNAVEGHEMQESIMNQDDEYTPYSQAPEFVPSPQDAPEYPQENYAPQQSSPQQYSPPQQEFYSPQQYQQYPQQEEYYQDYYQDPQSSYPQENSNMVEIAEQVVSENTKKIQRQVESLTEFKSMTENYIKLIEERIKRLETTLDHLQVSILDKVGSYGKNLNSIKKEMEMMQDSFSKVINPVLDRKK